MPNEPNSADGSTPANPPATTQAATTDLQWIRESMAVVVSLAITVLAALTLFMTFTSAAQLPRNRQTGESDAAYAQVLKIQEDAYSRQKDIMLYALALFGTVTGYYLGRVPAEVNANRAERSADAAQNQLAKAQDKLVDTSAKASQAVADAARSKDEAASAKRSMTASRDVLMGVRQHLEAAAVGPATMGAVPIDAGGSDVSALLRQVDKTIADIDAQA